MDERKGQGEIMYITKEDTPNPEKKVEYERALLTLLEILNYPEKYYSSDELIEIKSVRYF